MVGFVLVGLAVWTVIAGLRGPLAEKEPHRALPVVLILLGLMLQLVLVKPLGFTVGSGLLFAFTAAAFGYRKWHVMVPVGLVLAFLVHVVFDRVLQLHLPHGPIETLILGA
ncbi:MAG: tripartite tricarboxylate transporter TctB family protein [Pseudorhodobacter sp.]|nr:tripartite tricarboxylate transporter TctB family protein [Pseudorhodobacter sp.]